MLLGSPELFPCQAFRSLGLSGAGGLSPPSPLASFGSCATVPLLERIPFPTVRLFGWLCLRVWFLVAALGSPSPLETVFWFSRGVSPGLALGCRGVVWGVAAQKLDAACLGLSLVFFVKERVK